MSTFNASEYGPAIADIIDGTSLMPLGPGNPDTSAEHALKTFNPTSAFQPHTITDAKMAEACHSALWLYHNYLDISHTISQGIETSTGSYWHGIMHRREPDYSNSKGWFRRTGDHPIFPALQAAAADIAAIYATDDAAAFLTSQSDWDPDAFIDLCDAAHNGRVPLVDLCKQIQQREWELLFDHCWR